MTDRKGQLSELKQSGIEMGIKLQNILDSLGWNKQNTQTQDIETVCSLNSEHKVPANSLKQHFEKCELKKLGYSNDDIKKLVPSSSFYYENNPSIRPISIDKQKMKDILGIEIEVPVCNERSRSDLTPQQRLAIYEYVTYTAKCNSIYPKASSDSDSSLTTDLFEALKKKDKEKGKNQPFDRFELAAFERDQKRRRQSYRGKRIHTARKSYTEIVREVISNQNEYLVNSIKSYTESNCDSNQYKNQHSKNEKHHKGRHHSYK